MPISIRRAGPADKAALATVLLPEWGPKGAEHLDRFLERELGLQEAEPEQVLILLAEDEAEPAAWARAAFYTPPENALPNAIPAGWYLLGLVVREPFRRQGLGSRLVGERIRWLAGRTDVVHYFTNHGNEASLALHAHWGFEVLREDASYPQAFDPSMPMILLRARLCRG